MPSNKPSSPEMVQPDFPYSPEGTVVETPASEFPPLARVETEQVYGAAERALSRRTCYRMIMVGRVKRVVGLTVGSLQLRGKGFVMEQEGREGLQVARTSGTVVGFSAAGYTPEGSEEVASS